MNKMSYFPYWNTFHYYPRCSQYGDPCSSDAQCLQSCSEGINAGSVPARRMMCAGTPYEKARNMGKCAAAYTRVGDACTIGSGPLATSEAWGPQGTCSPGQYCQQTLMVDPRPNTAPTFAAPWVGQGYCMPLGYNQVSFWNQ